MITRISFLLMICLAAISCNESDELARELESGIIKLPVARPLDYTNSDLEPILGNLNEGIVALGEASHGSSTLFELKHRMLRYLVEEAGCRGLCYEFSYEKGLDINRYVLYGEGNIDSLLYDKYWIQSNSTIKEMLNWMKDYNEGLDVSEKIHFIGIDNQLDMFNTTRLDYHFNRYSNDLAGFLREDLKSLSDLGRPEYRNMDYSFFTYISGLIDSIEIKTRSFIGDHEGSFSKSDQEIISHLIYCMKESHDFLYNVYNGGPNNRDIFLASNVLWARSLFGDSVLMAVWAHNSHISSNPDYHGKGDGTMGYYLRNELEDKYLRIATSFNKGRVIAVEEDTVTGGDTPPHIINLDTIPIPGSVNELFARSGYENFILDLRKFDKESPLYNYLDTLRPFLGIGDFFTGRIIDNYSHDRLVNTIEAYDIIIHSGSVDPIKPQGKWIKH